MAEVIKFCNAKKPNLWEIQERRLCGECCLCGHLEKCGKHWVEVTGRRNKTISEPELQLSHEQHAQSHGTACASGEFNRYQVEPRDWKNSASKLKRSKTFQAANLLIDSTDVAIGKKVKKAYKYDDYSAKLKHAGRRYQMVIEFDGRVQLRSCLL